MPNFSNFKPKEIVWDDGLGEIAVKELAPYRWQLLHPFVYKTLAGQVITIPQNFESDGASSPARELITSWGGRYSTAALIHDYLYNCLDHGSPDHAAPTRKDADALLLEAMTRSGVNFWVRWGIWGAVRVFGGLSMRDL